MPWGINVSYSEMTAGYEIKAISVSYFIIPQIEFETDIGVTNSKTAILTFSTKFHANKNKPSVVLGSEFTNYSVNMNTKNELGILNLQFENVRITNEIPSYSGILMAALFLWMLAHIFITGVKLKQENDLTI